MSEVQENDWSPNTSNSKKSGKCSALAQCFGRHFYSAKGFLIFLRIGLNFLLFSVELFVTTHEDNSRKMDQVNFLVPKKMRISNKKKSPQKFFPELKKSFCPGPFWREKFRD